ncbi:lysylphosphatidylglycerol synthase transmembrane domain-containing protein [Acidobacteriota bacterium]
MKKFNTKHNIFFNVFALAAGIILFYFVIRISGKSFLNLLKQTADIKYYFLAAVTALSTLLSIFISKRWSLLMSAYTDIKELPRGFIFYNTNIGLLITSIIPIFGYAGTKSASFKLEHDVGIRKTLYATSLEYIMGFSVILALLIPSLLYVSGAFTLVQGMIAIGIMAVLLVIGFTLFFDNILKFLGFVFNDLVSRFIRIPLIRNISFLQRFTPEELAPFDKKTVAKTMGISLLIYFTVLVRGVIFLKAFNIDVNLNEFILLHVIGYALSCVGITPANIGVRELGWYGVLTLSGAGHEHAALFAVGQRIINTGTTIILAVAGYVFYAVTKRYGKETNGNKDPAQEPAYSEPKPQERL